MSTGVCNQDIMSHFPFSTVLNKDIQMERRRFSTSICPPIEIPATAAYPTHPCLPRGIRCVSWRREHPLGTVPSQAGISWGTGDWHAPKSPTAVLGGPRAPGRASIIHCLLFTNNPPTAHTGVSFCPLCCCVLPISPFLCPPLPPHTHFFILFCHSGAPPFRVSVAPARVPSPQRTKATACPTCHCRHNKGVRCDTCPCYTPLCIFPGVSFSPRTKTCE